MRRPLAYIPVQLGAESTLVLTLPSRAGDSPVLARCGGEPHAAAVHDLQH